MKIRYFSCCQRMARPFFSLYFCILALAKITASDLSISNELFFTETNGATRTMYAMVHVQWKNAWRNERNHDAAWIFCKFLQGEEGFRHVRLRPDGHEVLQTRGNAGLPLAIEVAADGNGLFLLPSRPGRGDVSVKLKLAIDVEFLSNFNPDRARFKAYGLEMVHIPEGGFWAGEPDSLAAFQYSAFFLPDDKGNHQGPLRIDSERALSVGRDLAYRSKESYYQGDGQGVLPEAFPKGFRAFYVMKYEISQGSYADFLNALSREQSQMRANFGGKNYTAYRGSIRQEAEGYVADSPGRPCNFLSWDDAMAFADWCALSPMTELEYEKACRGGRQPVSREFPWGSADKFQIERRVDAHGDLVHLGGKPESDLSAGTLAEFGASYYWVFDLSGSLWERCITVGDSVGRTFVGTHGDGVLSWYGFANNKDWPKGISETKGFGFRGGGFYRPDKGYGDFNPFSPVSYRPFGAWSGGNRSEAYGSRLVRRGP